MRRLFLLPLMTVLLLPACSTSSVGYMPEYLKEDSPLDPPGTAAARAALRAKYLKEGAFAKNDTPEVNQGKAFFFDRNPDRDENAKGTMVKTERVKVIACEGLYYFVQADDGQRGYVRESDLVPPVQLVSTLEAPIGEGIDGIFPELPPTEGGAVELENNQTLMTDRNGRTVVIKSKQTEKSGEFEKLKRNIINQGEPDSPAAPAAPVPDEIPDLPEPAALPEPAGGDAP